MNKPELIACYQAAAADPNRFDQGARGYRGRHNGMPFQGIAAARRAQADGDKLMWTKRGGGVESLDGVNGRSFSIEWYAQNWLGLNGHQAAQLFDPTKSLEDIRAIIRHLIGVDPHTAVPPVQS